MEDAASQEQNGLYSDSFLIYLGSTCPGNSAAYRGLGPHINISNQGSPSQMRPQDILVSAVSQLSLSSQMTVGCVRLTINDNEADHKKAM